MVKLPLYLVQMRKNMDQKNYEFGQQFSHNAFLDQSVSCQLSHFCQKSLGFCNLKKGAQASEMIFANTKWLIVY